LLPPPALDVVAVAVVAPAAGVAAALVRAEAALSQAAAGPVYVAAAALEPAAAVHASMLAAWQERPSGVEGIIAVRRVAASGPYGRRVRLDGARAVALEAPSLLAAGDHWEAGALLYASSRELCETIADEADNRGSPHPYETGLTRLMAWYRFRAHHLP